MFFKNSKWAGRRTDQSPWPEWTSYWSLGGATLLERRIQNYRQRGALQRHGRQTKGVLRSWINSSFIQCCVFWMQLNARLSICRFVSGESRRSWLGCWTWSCGRPASHERGSCRESKMSLSTAWRQVRLARLFVVGWLFIQGEIETRFALLLQIKYISPSVTATIWNPHSALSARLAWYYVITRMLFHTLLLNIDLFIAEVFPKAARAFWQRRWPYSPFILTNTDRRKRRRKHF